MKKLVIRQMVFEVTRKCNVKCKHCLRGKAEAVDMDTSHIAKFFKRVNALSDVTFSGGEPSLVPYIIDNIMHIAKEKSIPFDNFYIATNGVKQLPDFIRVIMELYLYCDSNEISAVKVSRDQYHREVTARPKPSLLDILVITQEESSDYHPEGLIAEGRAKKFPRARENREDTPRYYYDDENDDIMIVEEMTVYLNVHGDLINGCDWSYESQKDHMITNVTKDNWMGEFIEYVLEHGEQENY